MFGLQPTFIISTQLNGRSTPDNSQSVNIRPVNSLTVNSNYFMPGVAGGDHAFKIGGYWRDNASQGGTHTPGNAVARFPTSAELANPNDCATVGVGCQMQLTRDASTAYKLTNISLYGQDTITHGKLTLQLGLRYDYNHDRALSSSVLASPILPAVLPAVTFAGADPGIKFNNVSPRLGFTYNLAGDGKTVVHGNYAMYWGQVGVAGYSFQVNPVTRVSIRYPWVDLNHDTYVQANEVQPNGGNYANFLALTGNWNPAAPGSPTTANTIDPNLKNDRTGELIFGLDREIGAGFAVGVNYVWRQYSNFQFTDTLGLEPSNFSPTTFAPTNCPAQDGLRISAGNCTPVQVYVSNVQVGAISNLTNYTSDQYNRSYNGLEVTARKRMSSHWLMNTSFAYNSAIVNMNGWPGNSANGVNVANLLGEDPSNRSTRNGSQYDYSSAGSGSATSTSTPRAVQAERPLQPAGRLQRCGELQLPAGLSGRVRPQRCGSCERGRNGSPAAEPGRRDAAAELPESGLPRRSPVQDRSGAAHSSARHLQRVQRQHPSGRAHDPERDKR